MKPSTWYLLAVVLSAGLVSFEAAIERRRHGPRSTLVDTLGDASHFVGELTLTALLHLNLFAGYQLVEGRLALMTWDASSPLTWLVTLMVVDLSYWVGHFACHKVGALWALHAVHHQSRQFNFAAGIRGPWLSALQIAPFALPLLLLGLPSQVLFVVYAGHTAWKLLVHTRLVGRLGVLEGVFATPSQHRVHHASNPRFVDRNFGGMFSVWDRLFGTFQEEDEEPVLAPSSPIETYDPLAQNLLPWRALGRTARARGWVVALFGPPAAAEAPIEGHGAGPSDPAPLGAGARWLVLGSFGGGLAGALALTVSFVEPDSFAGWLLGAAVITSLVTMGRAIDQARGAPPARRILA